MPAITGQSFDQTIPGVFGENKAEPNQGDGVFGEGGDNGRGVVGHSSGHTGVEGTTKTGTAVFGNATEDGRGVFGGSQGNGSGVEGASVNGAGVFASSTGGEGVHAETHSRWVAAIAGFNLNPDGQGAAIFGKKEGQAGHAGFFSGHVFITGDLHVDGKIDGATISQLGEAIVALGRLEAQISGLEAQISGLQAQISGLQAHG